MSLAVNLLGELEVLRDGEVVALPPSRKTRALLAYLAVEGGDHRRDRLIELLWEVPDDPRAALRWSLSKLRGIVNDDDLEPLTATREHVSFAGEGVQIDLAALHCAGNTPVPVLSLEDLLSDAAKFRGSFLEGLNLTECPEFEIWCAAAREDARRLHVGVLAELVQRLEHQAEEALPHARKWAETDALDEAVHAAVVRLLRACGRRDEAKQHRRSSARILAEADIELDGRLAAAADSPVGNSGGPATSRPASPAPEALVQDIRFCGAPDGVRIAYSSVGSGPPIVKAANFLNHLEFDLESPVWRHLIGDIASRNTLIRYDERGTGLSDWKVDDITFEACVSDLEAVVDNLGLEKFVLFGISQGAAVSIAYAARHPERVSKMILHGGYALGWRNSGTPEQIAGREAMVTLMATGWGQDNPMFRQMFTSQFIPDATAAQNDWFNELQLVSTSPENAVKLERVNNDIDVRHLLDEVTVPTMVTHSRGEARVPFEAGRRLAMGIEKARFVPLESNNHLILEQEPAWQLFRTVFRGFVESES